METSTIIITILMVLVTLYKLYSIRKNGFKSFLTRKLIILPIIALIYGAFIIINPDAEIENPKTIITEYVSSVIY